MYQFDGLNKIITVSGVSSFAMIELYRQAREWEDEQSNMEYTSPIDAIGKESLKPDVFTDIVYTLTNGWKLKPSGYASGSTINVEGTVITDDNTAPTIPATVGSPVTWIFQVAYSGIITNVATGSGLSTAEHDKLMAIPTGATGLTAEQAEKLDNINTEVAGLGTEVDQIGQEVADVKRLVDDNQAIILSKTGV